MLMEKLSIIVPVYNAERTIGKCIDSILAQTFSNFELILINDGSNDMSLEICNKFKNKDERILIIDQENQGVSAARNRGIQLAKGDYIGFIDSDDWIEENMYEMLLREINAYDADIAMCGVSIDFENGDTKLLHSCVKRYAFDSAQAIEAMLENKICKGYLWNRIYKKELFEGLFLAEDIAMCEDVLISIDLFHRSSVIVYNTKSMYHYFQSGENMTQKGFSKQYLTGVHAFEKVYHKISELYPNLKEVAFSAWIIMQVNCCLAIVASDQINNNSENFMNMRKNIRRYMIKQINSRKISLKEKIKMILLVFPLPIINLICNNLKKIQNQ